MSLLAPFLPRRHYRISRTRIQLSDFSPWRMREIVGSRDGRRSESKGDSFATSSLKHGNLMDVEELMGMLELL